MKPVYNDHLMEYFSAFWNTSRWPKYDVFLITHANGNGFELCSTPVPEHYLSQWDRRNICNVFFQWLTYITCCPNISATLPSLWYKKCQSTMNKRKPESLSFVFMRTVGCTGPFLLLVVAWLPPETWQTERQGQRKPSVGWGQSLITELNIDTLHKPMVY